MARGPEFPKVRHIAVSAGERSAGADAVILPFEVVQPEPAEPAQGAPEGALPAAAEDPALHAGAQADAAAAGATHLGEAVVLEGIDRWYRVGSVAAGFCRSCELALIEALRESYGDHFEPFDPLAQPRAQPGSRTVPFAGAREALRFGSAVEAVKRAALRARDEARRGRGVEIAVLGRAASLNAASLAACRHL